ncbi:ATP synthase F0 subunit B [Geoalkalibacter halelectricus]|uniref:ATP synthase subunit b n=1 Tax=Geoalkalibacter halelectricus TaxID=2847045 RepID=A0ABY5ZM14_9BACT|nr:ATP synthase F0 subunit B [Geoalkalibacter halelectricus]MDO3378473.1 ATP synthase F0 subunit B [Geoalkalibacter halelectricus]UWZ80207.1 ATP synthase F0 subunit B [Geoalkalibacter halelectricus]
MIDFNWTFFLQLANFLILIYLLNVLLFRPLTRVMDERKQATTGGHQRARDLEEQIQAKMAAYREQLQAAKAEAATERAALRLAAGEEEARILGAAHQKAADQLKAIRNQVDQEAAAARQSLRDSAGQLAQQVASKVLGRSL